MSGQGGGTERGVRAGRGRWWVVKRRPPFKPSYFNSFSVPAWDFGVKVSTWLISLQWEDSAFRHRRANGRGAGKKRRGRELQGAASDVGQSAACGADPPLALRSLSHRLRTQEVWERCERSSQRVRGDADGPSAKLLRKVFSVGLPVYCGGDKHSDKILRCVGGE